MELGVRPKKISDSEKPLEQETFLVRGHWSTFEAYSAVATLTNFHFEPLIGAAREDVRRGPIIGALLIFYSGKK